MTGPHGASQAGEEDPAADHPEQSVRQLPRRSRRLITVLIGCAAVLTMVMLVWLWPATSSRDPGQAAGPPQVSGDVLSEQTLPCAQTPDAPNPPPATTTCGTAAVNLTDGPDAGNQITVDLPTGAGAPRIAHGDAVVLIYLPDAPTGQAYQIADHQRGSQLWILAAAFAPP